MQFYFIEELFSDIFYFWNRRVKKNILKKLSVIICIISIILLGYSCYKTRSAISPLKEFLLLKTFNSCNDFKSMHEKILLLEEENTYRSQCKNNSWWRFWDIYLTKSILAENRSKYHYCLMFKQKVLDNYLKTITKSIGTCKNNWTHDCLSLSNDICLLLDDLDKKLTDQKKTPKVDLTNFLSYLINTQLIKCETTFEDAQVIYAKYKEYLADLNLISYNDLDRIQLINSEEINKKICHLNKLWRIPNLPPKMTFELKTSKEVDTMLEFINMIEFYEKNMHHSCLYKRCGGSSGNILTALNTIKEQYCKLFKSEYLNLFDAIIQKELFSCVFGQRICQKYYELLKNRMMIIKQLENNETHLIENTVILKWPSLEYDFHNGRHKLYVTYLFWIKKNGFYEEKNSICEVSGRHHICQ